MDARYRDFPETGIDDAIDVRENRLHLHAAWTAARRRDDAVRARLCASGLHPQRESRATRHSWFDARAATSLTVGNALGRGELSRGSEPSEHQRHEVRLG